MSTIYCVLDYETRSEADLKKVGAWEYSVHPSTRVLCVAWRVGTREQLEDAETKVWSPAFPSPHGELIRALRDPRVQLIAHNAYFEQVITRNVLTRIIAHRELTVLPISRWTCTAAMAAAMALPRNLEGACLAMKLPVQKDMDGRKLILKYCKPRKPTKDNPAKWHSSVTDLKRIMQYCKTDVDAETHLFLALPQLNSKEREIWELDQKINLSGFNVDRPLVQTVLGMIEQETSNLNEETLDKSGLFSTNQRAEVLKWLESEGVSIPDLRAKTVSDALQSKRIGGDARRLLQIRQAVSKTSTAKYEAFEQRTRHDGRCRDILVYHTASTGRWGGAGVQPQNFPKGTIKNTWAVCDDMADGNLEWVRMIHGDPMSVFSSCLRPMIIPSKGMEFVCADYATIEVRVLFWIAEHMAGLKFFRDGEDIYRHQASDIFGRIVALILNPSSERDLGKVTILGCGFGMGKKKFLQSCADKGIAISEELAERAVRSYRTTHHPVVTLWGNLERVAIKAVQSYEKGERRRFRINKTTWWVEAGFLYCELPSGRRLSYPGPEVRYEETPWGEPKAVLYHWGVGMNRTWECSGTYGGKLTENVVQAIARDFMAWGMLEIDKLGYQIVSHTHDEVLAEQPIGSRPLAVFEKTMATIPAWGEGCPVSAQGWIGGRYKK